MPLWIKIVLSFSLLAKQRMLKTFLDLRVCTMWVMGNGLDIFTVVASTVCFTQGNMRLMQLIFLPKLLYAQYSLVSLCGMSFSKHFRMYAKKKASCQIFLPIHSVAKNIAVSGVCIASALASVYGKPPWFVGWPNIRLQYMSAPYILTGVVSASLMYDWLKMMKQVFLYRTFNGSNSSHSCLHGATNLFGVSTCARK